MYSVVCGEADMLVLVDLFNCPVECRAQTVGGITSALGKTNVVPCLLWASLIALRFLLLLLALAKLVHLSSAKVMLSSRNRLSLSCRRRSVCLMCCHRAIYCIAGGVLVDQGV